MLLLGLNSTKPCSDVQAGQAVCSPLSGLMCFICCCRLASKSRQVRFAIVLLCCGSQQRGYTEMHSGNREIEAVQGALGPKYVQKPLLLKSCQNQFKRP